jgi:hypothetical protein
MKQEKFNELMKAGEFEKMFIDNRIGELLNSGDLTKEQIDSLIQLGKDISKAELERRQKDLESQPGYEEYILSPMVAKILGAKTKKTKSVPQKTVEKTKKMKEKFDPGNLGKAFNKTSTSSMASKQPAENNVVSEKNPTQPKVGSINAGLYANIASTKISKLRKGDSVATVATKIYTVLKTDMEERKLRAELARDFGDEKLDNERKRHKELLDAVEKAKKKQPKVPVRDPKTGRFVKAETGKPGVPTPPQVGKGQPGAPSTAPKTQPKVEPKAPEPVKTQPKVEPKAPSTAPKTQPKVEPKAPEPVKTQPKVEPKAPEPPKTQPKPAEPVKTEPKLETKAPETPKPQPKTETKAPEAPKPTATKPPPEPAAPPTTTKVPPKVESGGVSTISKVAVGTAAAGIAQSIGAAESGGNYDISYGDSFDKKQGKFINIAKDPKTNKLLNLKTPEEFSGKKLTEMTLEEVKAFGEYRSKNGAGAGAVGKYQFMPTTLFGRYDKKGVFQPGLVQQLKVPMSAKFDGSLQERLQELLHTQDVATLKRMGVPITPGYEYMAHYIGAAGASAVFKSINRGEDKTVAQVMMDSGFSVGNNKELYEIKARNFEKLLQGRLEKKGQLAPHSTIPEIGKELNDSSVNNAEMKKLMRESDTSVNINAPTTIINKQNPKQSISKPTAADKPAIAGIP